jgi:hypothetical protein
LEHLSDLQSKIGSIIDKQDLPRNNCGSYSANNPVVTIDRKRLDLAGTAAVVTIGGEVDVWDCRENPSNVQRSSGFGTSSPTVRWWDCNPPFKNKLLTQPITLTIPVLLEKASETSVRVSLQKPNVELGGNPITEPNAPAIRQASQNQVVMARMVLRRACWAKAVSLSKVMDLRSAGSMRAKIASMTEMVSAAVFPTSLAAIVTRDLRS